ncbi:MAG TPA: FAD-dependent oxidoreductase [Rhodopila sp.]|nr:FAD-dependent oxidoreductase [Rhodopila sp.]
MRISVIGGGILGASTAYHAARAGAEVTVFDAERDGRATAAGAGIVCPWVSGLEDAPFLNLYVAGGEYYPAVTAMLAEDGETDLGYRQSGAMMVAAETTELAAIERFARSRATGHSAIGVITRLSSTDARRLFPPLHADLGGVHISGGARVDGRRMAAALLRAAARYGARTVRADAQPWIEQGRVRGVCWGNEREAADCVVVTAGAWAPLVPVRPQRGQIVHLQLADTATGDWPVILPPGSHYLVPFDDGRIVVGATREADTGFDYRVTAAGQAEVLFEALRIAPGLGLATVLETRVGFRPVLPRPVLGWLPGVDGLAAGNGLGAAGLTIGPLGGKLLADLVLGREPVVDLAPFAVNRAAAAAGEIAALR